VTARWNLGEVWVVRHAGFPFDWLEELGVPDAVQAAADEVLQREAELLAHFGGKPQREQAAREALERGALPAVPRPRPEEWPQQVARLDEARAALDRAWAEARRALQVPLRARAAHVGVQEAVFLSSPAMYENVWSRYAAGAEPPADNANTRRTERQVYTYLQRLCGKNETTSFFGPMAYGERAEDAPAVAVERAPRLVRRTFFSFWAVVELARAVNRDPDLLEDLPLRRNPLFVIGDGRAKASTLGVDVRLPEGPRRVVQEVMATCDATSASVRRALELPAGQLETALAALLKATVLLRGVRHPFNAFETFEGLVAAVRALPPSAARDRWVESLGALHAQRLAFQEAPFDARRTLLPRLEEQFTRLTGQPARRGEGSVYADRLIIYEEGGSRFRVRFGPSLFQHLERALSPALELSAAYGERVQAEHRAAIARTVGEEGPGLSFVDYAVKSRPEEVSGSRYSPVPPLQLRGAQGREAGIGAETWGASGRGGRYALPDVCLEGPPPEAGPSAADFRILLSRVHHHLLLYSWLAAFHPSPSRFEAAARRFVEQDPAGRTLLGLSIRRRNKGFYVFPGRRLVYSADGAAELEEGALGPDDVTVRRTREGPELLDPQGNRSYLYLALDDFSHYPPFAALAHPQVLHAPIAAEGPHVPRIRVGEVVYQRERWKLPSERLAGLKGATLYLAVRRFQTSFGWPRFVFVRSTVERKPYLIDTRSPFALDLLRHVAAAGGELSVDEMLPGPQGLWLRDEAGRYTCELRMQAVRPSP
jgi:hypothetical protein